MDSRRRADGLREDHPGRRPRERNACVGTAARETKDRRGDGLYFFAAQARRKDPRRARVDAAGRSRAHCRARTMNEVLTRPTLESVATINEDGSRRFIHPAAVRGRFARWRAIVSLILTAI